MVPYRFPAATVSDTDKKRIADELDNLQQLREAEAAQAKDDAQFADEHPKPVGGVHSAEALRLHLEKYHSPLFGGAGHPSE